MLGQGLPRLDATTIRTLIKILWGPKNELSIRVSLALNREAIVDMRPGPEEAHKLLP